MRGVTIGWNALRSGMLRPGFDLSYHFAKGMFRYFRIVGSLSAEPIAVG